jgi:hypothetical protein
MVTIGAGAAVIDAAAATIAVIVGVKFAASAWTRSI